MSQYVCSVISRAPTIFILPYQFNKLAIVLVVARHLMAWKKSGPRPNLIADPWSRSCPTLYSLHPCSRRQISLHVTSAADRWAGKWLVKSRDGLLNRPSRPRVSRALVHPCYYSVVIVVNGYISLLLPVWLPESRVYPVRSSCAISLHKFPTVCASSSSAPDNLVFPIYIRFGARWVSDVFLSMTDNKERALPNKRVSVCLSAPPMPRSTRGHRSVVSFCQCVTWWESYLQTK